MDEIKRIPIPTPFSIGRVNCYLLRGNGVTLMDPGPATQDAFDVLVESLESFDCSLETIDRVLITHPHIDHFGLAHRVAAQSNAAVFAHEDAVERLADPISHFREEQRFFRPFLQRMGMPDATIDTVLQLPESYTNYQEPVTVTTAVSDGDRIDGEPELTCLSTPGHNPGSMCYQLPASDIIFTGDHVLPTVTPNPLLTLDPKTRTDRTRSLPTYLESLRKLFDLPANTGYGGHGDTIPNVHTRAQETISHHQNRKERISRLIGGNEPVTAYELMQILFPDLPVTEAFPGISETVGHLDLLEDENRLDSRLVDGVTEYRLRE